MEHETICRLEAAGWLVECLGPLELRHSDGSFASLLAARYLVSAILAGEVGAAKISPESEEQLRLAGWRLVAGRNGPALTHFEGSEAEGSAVGPVVAGILSDLAAE